MILPQLRKLNKSFYLRPTLAVAKDLIGLYLVRQCRSERLVGRIVEVEAYLGERDPASHAYRGMTARNNVMFRRGGYLYVYFTYGMHFCCNVVTEREGLGRAVLLRAVEPLHGIELMARHRGMRIEGARDTRKLCSGPARLCEAFDIAGDQNGTDLCGEEVWIAKASGRPHSPKVQRSTRVGISQGTQHRWRFFEAHSPYISPGKPVDAMPPRTRIRY